jgi:hypothetical protein
MRRTINSSWGQSTNNQNDTFKSLSDEDTVPFWERGSKSNATKTTTEQQPTAQPLPPQLPQQTPQPQQQVSPRSQPPLKKRQFSHEADKSDDDEMATQAFDEATTTTASMSTATGDSFSFFSASAGLSGLGQSNMPLPAMPVKAPPRLPPFSRLNDYVGGASKATAGFLFAPPPQPTTPFAMPPKYPAPIQPPPPASPLYQQPKPASTVPNPSTPGFAPKNALHSLYGRAPRRKVISQDHYFTWNDQGPPHELKWTGIFVCPLTGEVFCSGRFGDARYYSVTINDDDNGSFVVWYTKKTLAEHGAAARCHDCLVWRDAQRDLLAPAGMLLNNINSNPPLCLGLDAPYDVDKAMMIPECAPRDIRQAILALQQQIRGPLASGAAATFDNMQVG